eukprot:1179465-Prorocentrum_minimum.AAC.8
MKYKSFWDTTTQGAVVPQNDLQLKAVAPRVRLRAVFVVVFTPDQCVPRHVQMEAVNVSGLGDGGGGRYTR